MSSPQTMREALVAELIGDLDDLLARTEALKTSLPGAADDVAKKVTASGDGIILRIEKVGTQLLADLSHESKTISETMQRAASDASGAAAVVDRAARRFALLALVTGMCGGVVGGLLVGMALAGKVFG